MWTYNGNVVPFRDKCHIRRYNEEIHRKTLTINVNKRGRKEYLEIN